MKSKDLTKHIMITKWMAWIEQDSGLAGLD
jgi:hypothetical protein